MHPPYARSGSPTSSAQTRREVRVARSCRWSALRSAHDSSPVRGLPLDPRHAPGRSGHDHRVHRPVVRPGAARLRRRPGPSLARRHRGPHLEDVDIEDPFVRVLDVAGPAGPAVLAVEFNGWQGSRPEVLARLSAGGLAASMYW